MDLFVVTSIGRSRKSALAQALALGLFLSLGNGSLAQPFYLPTSNHALFEPGGEERFFAPTPGKTWESGCFGCVRSDGMQMHEGLDIRCVLRDGNDEPADPVLATADGTVAYINDKPSLSNYGRYLVVQHVIDGVAVYSLYAHLHSVKPDLKPGSAVHAGEPIAVMGRTSNTSETITKDRAHVHFELNLFYNEHFESWYKAHFPKEHNDHSIWNGENLVGFDPMAGLFGGTQRRSGFQFGEVAARPHGDLPSHGPQDEFSVRQTVSDAGKEQPAGPEAGGGRLRNCARPERLAV